MRAVAYEGASAPVISNGASPQRAVALRASVAPSPTPASERAPLPAGRSSPASSSTRAPTTSDIHQRLHEQRKRLVDELAPAQPELFSQIKDGSASIVGYGGFQPHDRLHLRSEGN